MPNLSFANPGVAEKAPWRSLQSCVAGVHSLLENPYRFLSCPLAFGTLVRLVRGLLGTGPLDPTLESASPSPPQGSILHRFDIDSASKQGQIRKSMSNQCQIDVESMPNRPLRKGGLGGFEAAVRGACA